MRDRRRVVVLWLERLLTVVGAACLGYYWYVTAEATAFQRQQTAAFEQIVAAPPLADAPASSGAATDAATPAAGLIGVLEIPRLNVTTPVITGEDERTLQVAAGHLADTPRPWEPGNSAIAAHRDGLFRPLKNIQPGDEVRIRTARGTFTYEVTTTKIVAPDDLSVLRSGPTSTLTLITCYPFNYVGAAPRRFIVSAERLEEGLLPSRDIRRLRNPAPAPRAVSRVDLTPAPDAGSRAARSRPRLARTAHAGGKASRQAASARDRHRGVRASVERDGPRASRRSNRDADRPAKPRRWYHFLWR